MSIENHAPVVTRQGGLRWLMMSLILSLVLGSLVRLILSPKKVDRLLRARIESSELHGQLRFQRARIELANGWLPDFALVVEDVEWRPLALCEVGGTARLDPPVRAKMLRLPPDWFRFLRGQISIGQMTIDDLVIDVDEAKKRCPPAKNAHHEVTQAFKKTEGSERLPQVSSAKLSTLPFSSISAVNRYISGIFIGRGEILFEGRMKSLIIGKLQAIFRDKEVDLTTKVRVPPATVFGESLPTFNLKAKMTSDKAIVKVRADLNEGTLELEGLMNPVGELENPPELNSDIVLKVKSLPLSIMTPLLVKSRVMPKNFQPKFAWLDCEARVRGKFSRLLVDYPLEVTQCEVSGQVGKLKIDRATRDPDGRWGAFTLLASEVDVGRVLDTFHLEGASGVFSQYGKYTGQLAVKSPTDFSFSGRSEGSVLKFEGGGGTAFQAFGVQKISGGNLGEKLWFDLSGFHMDGGIADLDAKLKFNLSTKKVEFESGIRHLKFQQRVEKALFSGSVADISGTVRGGVEGNRLASLRADFDFKGVQGTEFSSPEIRIEVRQSRHSEMTETTTSFSRVHIKADSPMLEVPRSSYLFQLLKPSLLGWDGRFDEPKSLKSNLLSVLSTESSLVLSRVTVVGHLGEEGYRWQEARASVGNQVGLSSHGILSRNERLDAQISSEFPSIHGIVWKVSGKWTKPVFEASSRSLKKLLAEPSHKRSMTKEGSPIQESIEVLPARLGLAPGAGKIN